MPKADKEYNMHNNEVENLQCSYLIVNPVKRKEIWRFITYVFLHANHQHIGFNLLMQLLIGKSKDFFENILGSILTHERMNCLYRSNTNNSHRYTLGNWPARLDRFIKSSCFIFFRCVAWIGWCVMYSAGYVFGWCICWSLCSYYCSFRCVGLTLLLFVLI